MVRQKLLERTQIMEYMLHHENSGYFQVQVYPTTQTTTPYEYTVGSLLGSETIVGGVPLSTGTARIPVRADSTAMRLIINNNTHLPHHIVSAEWSAKHGTKLYRG